MSEQQPEKTKPSLSELLIEAMAESSQNWERVAKLEHSVGILINYLNATVKDAFQELVERVEAWRLNETLKSLTNRRRRSNNESSNFKISGLAGGGLEFRAIASPFY